MAEPRELPRHRFGPLERRGFLLGLRLGQVVALAGAGLLAVGALQALPGAPAGAVAIALALGGAAIAFWPLGGRTPEAWLPLLLAYGWRRLRGRHRFRSEAQLLGHLVTIRQDGGLIEALPPEARPESVEGLSILEVQPADGSRPPAGVVKDAGQRTYTAMLRVRGRAFALLDQARQASAVQAWASILAGYGQDGSAVSRLQWIERTLPDDAQALARHFEERAPAAAPEAVRRLYARVISEARPAVQEHECLLALQVDGRRAWRQIRQLGGRDLGACALLLRELDLLGASLEAAGLETEAALSPRAVSAVIRTAYEPGLRPRLRVIETNGGPEGPHPHNTWPQAALERFACYQSGPRAFHATFHVREWPRIEVGPGFLAPLLLRTQGLRTVAMTLEPLPRLRAERALKRALAAGASDDQLRQKAGWLSSFRHLREQENVLRTEQELADGHTSYRFSAYLTVSAPSEDDLEAACVEMEHAASRCHLELERLLAQQELAFTYTLPLCRGLK